MSSVSSTLVNPPYSYPAGAIINGDRKGVSAGSGGNWAANGTSLPQWVQVDFNGIKTIREIDVFSLQDNYSNPIEPTETTTFSQWGLTAFDVQYWNGSAWVTVPGGSVTGNNKVWKKITFDPIDTSKIRVVINATVDSWTRVVEVEAWTRNINWLVTDHLGTPRMIIDQAGTLATVKRHDYLPFGEELLANMGGRSAALGYTGGDGVRQQFTSKERDNETGLDYFLARYHSSTQGRFISIDPYNIVMERQNATDAKKAQSQFITYLSNPQRWARYTYALNNPLLYTDPDGKDVTIYYRPAEEGAGSKEDYGHIFIYVRNDETGESAYFDYMATGTYNDLGVTQIAEVDQKRIDRHASLTIETNASQEQTILDG